MEEFWFFPVQKDVKYESSAVSPAQRLSQGSESSFGNTSVVDPVVVSFEEGMRLF